jgi:hypothetical protein
MSPSPCSLSLLLPLSLSPLPSFSAVGMGIGWDVMDLFYLYLCLDSVRYVLVMGDLELSEPMHRSICSPLTRALPSEGRISMIDT